MSKEENEIKKQNRELVKNAIKEQADAQKASKAQIAKAQAETEKLAKADEERKRKAQEQEISQREAQQKYESALETQTGEKGYNKALDMATRGAALTSAQAGNSARQAARQMGLGKAQAAQLGASQAANAYAQNIANQQNVATNSNQANVAGNLSNAGLVAQNAQANTNNAQQGVSNTQQGIQNQMSLVNANQAQQGLAQSGLSGANASLQAGQDRVWGNVNNAVDATGKAVQAAGNIVGMIASDKRLKESEKIKLPEEKDAKKLLDDMETRLLSHSLKGLDVKKLAKIEPEKYIKKTIIEVGK